MCFEGTLSLDGNQEYISRGIHLKVEAQRPPKRWYPTTCLCYNPEDHDLNLHYHENLKSGMRGALRVFLRLLTSG
jgi:hypothetical protein